jgi:hypothetical protein
MVREALEGRVLDGALASREDQQARAAALFRGALRDELGRELEVEISDPGRNDAGLNFSLIQMTPGVIS